MAYLALGLGGASLVASLLVWWFKRKADDLQQQLYVSQNLVKVRGALNDDLRNRLNKALAGVKAAQDKEAAASAERAKAVTDAAGGADFLNDSVRKDR